jgi:general secretion pathway protein C
VHFLSVRIQHARAFFWVFDLALTATAVFFLVRGTQFILAAPISEPPPLAVPQIKQNDIILPKIKSYEHYASLRKSNLFGSLSTSNVSIAKKVEENLPETTLDLELLGCAAMLDPQTSFAIIRDKKARTENTYGVGDYIVSDARLEEVRPSEVVISRAGQREVLAMTFTEKGPAGPRAGSFGFPRPSRLPAAVPQAPDASSEAAVRVVNENLRYVNRAKLIEEIGNNFGQLASQLRTSPNVIENKPAGVKIDQLGADPVLGQSGLQPGDIVKSVNGIRVNSLDDLLGQNERLQNAPEIRVVVERDGRHRTLVYKIR